MPKAAAADKRQERRHNPLSEEYLPSQPLKQKAPKRKSRNQDDEEHFVDSKASQRILKIGQELADEDEAESNARRPQAANTAFAFESRFAQDVESDDEDDDGIPVPGDDDAWGDDDDEEVEEIEVDPEDLAMFNKFNPEFDPSILLAPTSAHDDNDDDDDDQGPGTNLADLILNKIAQHEAQRGSRQDVIGGGPPEDAVEIPGKVVEVYTQYVVASCIKHQACPQPLITTTTESA